MRSVFESGSHQHFITVDGAHTETMTFEANSSGNISVFVTGSGLLKLDLVFGHDSTWTYLWVNQSEGALVVEETLHLKQSSHVKASYGELTGGNHRKQTEIIFEEPRSSVVVRSAALAFDALKWKITANHQAKHTEAHLNSYGIVPESGSLEYEVIGFIENGMSGSKTHQMTRVMNLGSHLKTVVYPKLLIEENDVEASHAASVGQPDEDQVYYMQSRGLTRDEALKLITLGYLLPIASEVEDTIIRERLVEEIEAKVSQEWMR